MHLVLELRERAGGELLGGEVLRVRGGVGCCGDGVNTVHGERELGEGGADVLHTEKTWDTSSGYHCAARQTTKPPLREMVVNSFFFSLSLVAFFLMG